MRLFNARYFLALGLAVRLLAESGAYAAEAGNWTLAKGEQAVPEAFGESIRGVLSDQSAWQALQEGESSYTFWFRSKIPLKSKPDSLGAGLKSIAETTLLGVVQVGPRKRDYRDDQLYDGLYTIRFSLQPQDGNHLGTAEYPYFAVLTPVKWDTKLDGITSYRDLVKASSRDSAGDHPFILSLRPVNEDKGEYPRVTQPAPDHTCLRVKLPAQADGASADLVFDVVIEGMAVH